MFISEGGSFHLPTPLPLSMIEENVLVLVLSYKHHYDKSIPFGAFK